MVLFSIKKCLKALIRRLKVGYIYSIVRNYPRTTSEVVDNIINTVNIFKRQYINDKAFQLLVVNGEAL